MPVLRTMKRLQPSRRTITAKVLTGAALLALGTGAAWCDAVFPQRVVPLHISLTHLEQNLRRIAVHISEFSIVSESRAALGCGEVRPPEALLTPDPMLQPQDDDLHVQVSFIVGSDGHVHSAFILDSGGPDQDQLILRAISRWRYRPALCNGVPTDSEARVRFALR
ncbi:MAG: energy transducer TonB [Acidobacteriia bacterium]|nr:energy transducer TonB [Terriglobia bacterium]